MNRNLLVAIGAAVVLVAILLVFTLKKREKYLSGDTYLTVSGAPWSNYFDGQTNSENRLDKRRKNMCDARWKRPYGFDGQTNCEHVLDYLCDERMKLQLPISTSIKSLVKSISVARFLNLPSYFLNSHTMYLLDGSTLETGYFLNSPTLDVTFSAFRNAFSVSKNAYHILYQEKIIGTVTSTDSVYAVVFDELAKSRNAEFSVLASAIPNFDVLINNENRAISENTNMYNAGELIMQSVNGPIFSGNIQSIQKVAFEIFSADNDSILLSESTSVPQASLQRVTVTRDEIGGILVKATWKEQLNFTIVGFGINIATGTYHGHQDLPFTKILNIFYQIYMFALKGALNIPTEQPANYLTTANSPYTKLQSMSL